MLFILGYRKDPLLKFMEKLIFIHDKNFAKMLVEIMILLLDCTNNIWIGRAVYSFGITFVQRSIPVFC
ncbi:Uncharacterised protein [Mycobacteroides abscessus subsp. abscessus]|nr:Uncharacterised protein [Mycobacteroides abscessus subsp. abscessus]